MKYKYSYRTHLKEGQRELPQIHDLSIAFNRIAAELATNGLLMDLADLGKCVRIEGMAMIGRRRYRALMQGTLCVVQGDVKIPDRIEVRT